MPPLLWHFHSAANSQLTLSASKAVSDHQH
jgi:hypothetical protein